MKMGFRILLANAIQMVVTYTPDEAQALLGH